jgi:hypothetical protein
MLLSDYITQVQFLIHDQTNADFTQSELATQINDARTAVSLDFHCCRQAYLSPAANAPNLALYGSVSTIQNQEIYPLNGPNGLNGQVVGANVLTGGSGYSAATIVTFSAGPTGSVRATAVPVIANGVITGINMTAWGTGYQPALPVGVPSAIQPPTVTISDTGGGVGATATATMFNNVFNVISISYLWGNQRYSLRFRGFTLFQAYMRSQLFFTQRGLIWTIHEQMGYVLIQPPPDQNYVTEWDVLCTPLPLLNPGDTDTQITPPWNDAVQYYAAYKCLLKLQNFQQAEFMLKLYSARVPKIIIGAGGVRIPNPYHKTFQRRVSR